MIAKPFPRWPLAFIALPATVAIWSGWVGLGERCGFGLVQPLPGISPWHLNTAITLPVGLEFYAAYALGAWLAPGTPRTARRFACWSAMGALLLGMTGQASYHLLAAYGVTRVPMIVVVIVSCVPVAVLGFAAALTHLLRAGGEVAQRRSSRGDLATLAMPVAAALAARIKGTPAVPAAAPSPEPSATASPAPSADPVAAAPAMPVADALREAPAIAVAPAPREAKPAPSVTALARVRRKGPVNATDDEVKAAIRELRTTDPGITMYKVAKLLRGPKGGIGDPRVKRLLSEVAAERPSLRAVAGE